MNMKSNNREGNITLSKDDKSADIYQTAACMTDMWNNIVSAEGDLMCSKANVNQQREDWMVSVR
jgi:hypothetical protein